MKKLLAMAVSIAILTTTMTVGVGAVGNNVGDGKKDLLISQKGVQLSVSKIEKENKDIEIKIITPRFAGFDAAEKINAQIINKTTDAIGGANSMAIAFSKQKEENKKNNEESYTGTVSLDTNFDYTQEGNILSTRINTYYYGGGAHGSYWVDGITANTKTNEIYTFESLFKPQSNFQKVVNDSIIKSISKDADLYFVDAKETVKKMNSKFKFYIDGNKLVVYFDLYELSAYAYGMPKFSFSADELKGVLKEDIYNAMSSAKPSSKFKLNGADFTVAGTTYTDNYTLMVPLKPIAETLGYKVGWDSKNGAIVAAGYIKNGVNSYYVGKKAPQKLAAAPKMIKGITYVPVNYFSEILGENVRYDGDSVRIYTKIANDYTDTSIAEKNFIKQIADFTSTSSADESVKMYAQAVKDRKGAIQYALYSDKMRELNVNELLDMMWVTGTSSPWITGFDIKKTGVNTYSVTYHWAITKDTVPDTKAEIKVESMGEQWKIVSVVEK